MRFFSSIKLAALISAGAVLLTGCIQDSADAGLNEARAEDIIYKGDIAVARVGETKIYQSDVVRAAKAQKRISETDMLDPESELFSDILDELIDQRLLKLDALEEGLEVNPEVMRRLYEARERVLATYLVESRLKSRVTDDSLREIYQAQSALRQNQLEADVLLIQTATEDEVNAVLKRLEAGEDFGVIAGELSTEQMSKNNDGELGFVSRVMLPDDLAKVVFAAKAGTQSKAFETTKGWNVIEVRSFRKPQQASFESVRQQLRQYKTYAEIQQLMTQLRDSGDIEVYNIAPALRGEASQETQKEIANE